MRRSTTSAATDRRRLAAFLLAELICALFLIGRSDAAPPGPTLAAPASLTTPTAPATSVELTDGRTVRLIALGGAQSASLLSRVAGHLDAAVSAVTAFWGPDWPRDIVIVAAASPEQFATLAGGTADTAATTTVDRIMFAPGAAGMDDTSLRIVLRHELFHFAARADTAVDAPQWLTEGVADYVARPATDIPPLADELMVLPTDADLAAAGPERSTAYDRAWLFSRFVAERYGPAALRALYMRACGHRHPDVTTAVRDTLGTDLDTVLAQWRQWL
ncbi:peptidase [Mycobacterium deserti]|uniref:Peptidase n=1 Tax=Mycobacterium deserti TaxID=2978347 RepID=A0ABT2MFQ1_9MYCO|nr:peptidase [Mycobacterium deserti]MCT7660205.1 peptidase [Mycobacterium deserti]